MTDVGGGEPLNGGLITEGCSTLPVLKPNPARYTEYLDNVRRGRGGRGGPGSHDVYTRSW